MFPWFSVWYFFHIDEQLSDFSKLSDILYFSVINPFILSVLDQRDILTCKTVGEVKNGIGDCRSKH